MSKALCSLFALSSLVQTAWSSWPIQTFHTEPEFQPPILSINKTGAHLAEGLIVFTPEGSNDTAPMIFTDSGDLIWNGPAEDTTNLFVQSLDSRDVLTFWSGTGYNVGRGYGNVTVLDDTYSELCTVCPDFPVETTNGTSSGCALDLHESFITPRGTMLATVVNVTTADLSPIGGPEVGWVFDTMFLEIDIKTQEILFQWSPLQAGIPINSTKLPLLGTGTSKANPFDWSHMNSVETLGDGYLANSRHCWSTYAINRDGEVEWTIEGSTGGDFTLPDDVGFVSNPLMLYLPLIFLTCLLSSPHSVPS